MIRALFIYFILCPVFLVLFACIATLCFMGSYFLFKLACHSVVSIGTVIYHMWTGDIIRM